jgi:hypothetical protein
MYDPLFVRSLFAIQENRLLREERRRLITEKKMQSMNCGGLFTKASASEKNPEPFEADQEGPALFREPKAVNRLMQAWEEASHD